MGLKSTFEISRGTAIEVILDKIEECSNDQLSLILEEFKESEYRNYSVQYVLDEDSNPDYTIANLEDFNTKHVP